MAYRINWSAFSVPEFNEAQDAVRTLDLDILTEGICEAGYWAESWIRRMASSIFRGDVPASVIGRVEAVSPSAAEHLRFASVSSEFGALDFTSHRAVANIDRVDTSQFSAYSLDALNRLTQALGAGPVSSAVDALNVMAPDWSSDCPPLRRDRSGDDWSARSRSGWSYSYRVHPDRHGFIVHLPR